MQRLRSENELLRNRILRLPAENRSRYLPWERLQILWHQARHGLSLRETAKRFAVQASTVAQPPGPLKDHLTSPAFFLKQRHTPTCKACSV